ncbi:hypothetical protein LINGRAHAP2_LOCUS25823 [Linum grandiflorum]
MKFEDYLAEQADLEKHQQQRRRNVLEEEVEKLHEDLDEQQAIGKVMQSALDHGPVLPPHPCIASLLPPQVQGLLAEMAIVEEEIMWLERKVNDLKLGLYYERKLTKKTQKAQLQQQRRKSKQLNHHLPVCEEHRSVLVGDLYQVSRSQRHGGFRKDKFKFRRASAGSAEEVLSVLPTTVPSPSKPKKKPDRARVPPLQKELVPYLMPRDIMLRETK